MDEHKWKIDTNDHMLYEFIYRNFLQKFSVLISTLSLVSQSKLGWNWLLIVMKEHFGEIKVFYTLDVVILTWVCTFDISYNYTPKMVWRTEKERQISIFSWLRNRKWIEEINMRSKKIVQNNALGIPLLTKQFSHWEKV